MITHRTCIDLPGITPADLYDLMVNPTDTRYRKWWPGTHTAFHVVRRDPFTSPIGDVVVMDERVGRRRLRFRGTVRVAEPSRRIVWQLRKGLTGPAWLDITLTETPGGVRGEHELRLGWAGPAGACTDPLIRLYFTPAFADALTVHASTEFPLLSPGASGAPVARPLPSRGTWGRAAAATLGRDAVAPFLTDLEVQYARVRAERPDFIDATPVLTGHFERSIAPMIAVFRTFSARGDGDPYARTAELVETRWQQMARIPTSLARLPVPWRMLSGLIEQVTRRFFPAPGWDVTWVERSQQRVAFDIHDCVYQRAFTHFGVPELTRLACRGDDILYARLPGARFVRHGTLGRGDPICDFAFERTPGPAAR